MKKINITSYRKYDRKFKLKRFYFVSIKKAHRNNGGNLIMPLPSYIVKAYHIEIGDIAVFNIVDKKKFMVKFVKNNMYGLVEFNKN